nr:ANTAR domain-containing protein [uncultured Nocardioides sp.]
MRPSATADEIEDNQRLVRALEAAVAEIDHLRVALDRRLVIGQAQGMLMERLGIDAGQAIDYLKRVSSQRNQKVFVIAEDIVRTRELPGP